MASGLSPNFDERPTGCEVSILLLHYTGMKNGAEALARLCDDSPSAAARVSAHYLIDEAGEVCALVAEDKRAWHAGEGFWRGTTDINACSLGIELVNGGHAHGLPDYPDAQMKALEKLAAEICARHHIKFVLGHEDIAPGRKQDPGEKFNWQRLAQKNIGVWIESPAAPDEETTDPAQALPQLHALGYNPACSAPVLLTAFQRHWRQARVDGRLDSSTRRTLDLVLEKL